MYKFSTINGRPLFGRPCVSFGRTWCSKPKSLVNIFCFGFINARSTWISFSEFKYFHSKPVCFENISIPPGFQSSINYKVFPQGLHNLIFFIQNINHWLHFINTTGMDTGLFRDIILSSKGILCILLVDQ